MNDIPSIAGWSAAILLALSASAGAQPRLGAVVIGSGGVTGSGGNIRLQGTLGQTIIGPTVRPGLVASQGFWYTLPQSTPLSAAPEDRAGAATSASAIALRCAPNPFAGSTLLQADLPARCHVSLAIYDLLGRPVRTMIDEEREAGHLSATVAADGLESGRYTAVLVAGGSRTTAQLMVIR